MNDTVQIETKRCSKCKYEKALDEFYDNKAKKCGKHNECKLCNKEYKKEYYAKNPEKIRKQQKERREANPEKISKQRKEHYAANREKINKRQRKRREANPEKQREYQLKGQYNLTPERYAEMLDEQGHRCKSCREPFGDTTPHVDHDHACCPDDKSCGECIRGLLCKACNNALGNVKDDPTVSDKLSVYLREWKRSARARSLKVS